MNETEFDRLLDLYQKGLLTGKEKEFLENWLHQVDTGESTPLTIAEIGRLKENIKRKIQSPTELPLSTEQSSFPWPTIIKIAASVLVFLAVGIWALNIRSDSNNLKTIAGNGIISKVALPDGTLVWLKGTSSLQMPNQFSGNARNVILHGEALFEVAKDPHHPFVIECGKITTTVVGTSFNLKSSSSDQVELTVLTGKVSLNTNDDPNGVIVLPNERVTYDHEKLLVDRKNITPQERAAAIDGTEYSMLFNDAALAEIFGRIERKFDVTITLSNEALRNCVIRADFSDQSLNETMDMICRALALQYTIKGSVVHLTGKGC
jgi:ferric-dicitrate binding protein FerR (iron transport regulator)